MVTTTTITTITITITTRMIIVRPILTLKLTARIATTAGIGIPNTIS
jgi:hypothetical protein